MITFFSCIPIFKDEKNLDTQTFLQLSKMICDFFGLWDSKFSLLRNDVEGNIKKVTRASTNLHVSTLYDLLANEINRDDSSGSIGLLWLKRTIQFVICFLHHFAQSKNNELVRDIIARAYDETLTKYHNKLMRRAFRLFLHIVPKRSVFIRKLGLEQDNCEFIVLREAEQFVRTIEPHLQTLNQMLILFGLEDPLIT
uniref:Glycolipid transfer protein-related n=1 Tax=Schistosoma mansoni TaxID=6183 RepID=A0A5K4FEG5_SCHMA